MGMCGGEVPRGRRACVKSGSADGWGRAPNLTAATARAFSDLIWWFYNQSGKEAVYLRGITECTVLAFRLCATGLGLPWVASPSVSEDVRRHGAYHYLRMDLATSALQAAVLRGESVPAAMFSRSHYSTLQAWLPASDRRRWPYHRCCYSRGPTGAPLPKVKVVASASGVVDGGVPPEGPDPPPQARLGVRDARLSSPAVRVATLTAALSAHAWQHASHRDASLSFGQQPPPHPQWPRGTCNARCRHRCRRRHCCCERWRRYCCCSCCCCCCHRCCRCAASSSIA